MSQTTIMRITEIDLHVLLVPDYDPLACSWLQDDLVVEVHTDEGIVGVGETDTNPWITRECIRARGTHCMGLGLQEMLLGQIRCSPKRSGTDVRRLEDDRPARGLDLCHRGDRHGALGHQGQGPGLPVWKLLAARAEMITPYASLLPTGRTLEEYRESLVEKA